jgi:hypothetical protein
MGCAESDGTNGSVSHKLVGSVPPDVEHFDEIVYGNDVRVFCEHGDSFFHLIYLSYIYVFGYIFARKKARTVKKFPPCVDTKKPLPAIASQNGFVCI